MAPTLHLDAANSENSDPDLLVTIPLLQLTRPSNKEHMSEFLGAVVCSYVPGVRKHLLDSACSRPSARTDCIHMSRNQCVTPPCILEVSSNYLHVPSVQAPRGIVACKASVQEWNRYVESLAARGLDASDEAIVAELHPYVASAVDSQSSGSVAASLPDVLEEEIDRLADDLDCLHNCDTVDALSPADQDAGQHAPASRSKWFNIRFELVHDGDDPSTDMTVLQAAFHHVEAVHRGSTIAQVEMDIKRAVARYAPSCGKPAPDNPKCRYPPTYYLCKVICDVSDLSEAEVHMCPNSACPHMTAFPRMARSDLLRHVQGCSRGDCTLCYCPCGGRRLTQPDRGCMPQPQAPCYFFADVFQQFFLDTEWYNSASVAHRTQQANFYSNPEGQRILAQFEEAGVPSDMV